MVSLKVMVICINTNFLRHWFSLWFLQHCIFGCNLIRNSNRQDVYWILLKRLLDLYLTFSDYVFNSEFSIAHFQFKK